MSPDAEAICIEDIAHALSLICRGNGHVKTFWSVAQHCICCAKEAAARGLPDRMILACLLHDAGECYLSDIPRPFKEQLPAYREQEEELLDIIYTKFLGSALTEEEQKQLKEIDDGLLWYDLEELLDETQYGDVPDIHIEPDYTVRPFEMVEQEYLHLFYHYSGMAEPKQVFLEDIADAFESCFDGWSQFLKRSTGEILSLPNGDGLTDIEEEDEEFWEEIEESDDYLRLPDQYEKQIMENFAASVVRPQIANRLWKALHGRHPYRYFKDAIQETGMAQKYYDYRFQAYMEKAEEWCRENRVRYTRKA